MSTGLVTSSVITRTTRKTDDFAKRMASKNSQLTELRSSVAIDMKIRDGKEKVPTKVFNPLASVAEIMFNLPATYLKEKIMHDITHNVGIHSQSYIPTKNHSKTFY
jgi:hypothetical protein